MRARAACAFACALAMVASAGNAAAASGSGLKSKSQEDVDEPWVTGTARFADRFYEGGPFFGSGGMFALPGVASSVALGGVRVAENHGYISKVLVGTLVAMGQGNSAYVGSTYSKDAAGNVWRTDYYRSLTPAEQEAQRQALHDAISAEYLMELNVYSAGIFGSRGEDHARARGFEFYLGGETELGERSGKDLPIILQIAFVGAFVRAPDTIFKAGEGPGLESDPLKATNLHREDVFYSNLGLMLRAHVPITAWLEAFVQADLNVLTLFDLSGKKLQEKGYAWTSPFRGGINLNATDRVYLRALGSLNGFGAHGIGWQGEIGVRF